MIYIIILAIVQGLTEFLPVSSSGHLVLLNKFFNIQNDFLILSVILHVATLLSVVWVLRKEVLYLIKNPFSKETKKLAVATLPTVLIVLVFKGVIDSAFSGKYLPICFMITAFVIVVSEIINKKVKKEKELSYKSAIFMGIAQGIAVLPGISRSGATICSGLALGNDRKTVAHFSFLMSVPIIIASLVLEIYEYISTGTALVLAPIELIVGFLVAFITGILSVKFMLKVVEKSSLIWFAVYLIGISVVSFLVIV